MLAWIVLITVLALVGGLGVLVLVNRLRFERRLAGEMSALLAQAPLRDALSPSASGELPPPVARYRALAVGDRAPVRTLALRHGGSFCMRPGGKEAPIQGCQLFTADPPGFVWTGRIRMAPGVWVDARDMSVGGEGSMRVFLDDTFPIADARGPQLDQGAALRLLAEMAWYPTALFDARTVRWSAVDADHARATLRLGEREVSGIFAFGPDGLPLQMSAERCDDKGEVKPWGGVYRDFRAVSGMLVPFEADVSWLLPAGPFTYARWRIDSMVFDEELPAELLQGTLLKTIKLAHTVVWAFLAACVLAIPLASWAGEHRWAAWLAGIIAVETVVLALNRGRCPLTGVAARYTKDRRDNFDIYLPAWLARYNKHIFGTLYLLGVAFALFRWARA